MSVQIKYTSFRAKLLLSLFGLNFIVGCGIIFFAHNDIVKSQKELISKNISSLAFSLSEQIKPALEFDDKETVEEIIDGILNLPDAEFIGIWKISPFESNINKAEQTNTPTVISKENLFFAKNKKGTNSFINVHPRGFPVSDYIKWDENRVRAGRILSSGQVITGYLLLSESLDSFLFFKKELNKLLVTALLIHLTTSTLIALWVEKSLTKPLLELVKVAEKISSKNDLFVRARKLSNDEFGKLTIVFNKMLDSIHETNEELLASNKEMENRVIERTKDLDLANQKLQLEIKTRIQKNKELLDLQNQIGVQQRLASIGKVSSNIAHELRNPMAAIRNSVYFLRKSLETNEKSKKHLEIIDQQLTDSDQVIGRLLEITKEKALKLSQVYLEELCRETFSVLGVSEEAKLKFQADQKNLNIEVDRILFRQVLLNLFLNSIQAKQTDKKVLISVNVKTMNKWIDIEVSDDGPGIPKNIQNRIFEPLFSTKDDGFGLGLSFCYDIIARHRGSFGIKYSSKLGTTFSIRIPNTEHI